MTKSLTIDTGKLFNGELAKVLRAILNLPGVTSITLSGVETETCIIRYKDVSRTTMLLQLSNIVAENSELRLAHAD